MRECNVDAQLGKPIDLSISGCGGVIGIMMNVIPELPIGRKLIRGSMIVMEKVDAV